MMSEILFAVGAPVAAVFAAGLSAILLPPDSALARDLGLADRAAPAAETVTELASYREPSQIGGPIREAA